ISNTGSLIADGANVILDNSSDANVTYVGTEIFINNGGSVTFCRSGSKDQFWISNQTTITFDENGGGTFYAGDSHGLNLVNNSQTRFVTNGGATNYVTGSNGFNLHGQSLTFDVAKGTSESGIDLELSARLWNNQGVIKNGEGTMSITYNNTNNGYRGATLINAGTLVLAGNGTFGAGTSAISVASGATLKFAGDLVQTTVANPFSGTGMIVKDGTNTVTLTGTNTYTGDVKINGGSLDFLMNGTNKNLNVGKVSGSGDLVLRLASGNGDTKIPSIVNDGFTGSISLVQEGAASSNKLNSNGQSFEGFKIKVNPGTSIYINSGEFKPAISISGNGNSENRGALRVASTLSGDLTVMADANIGVDGTRTISSKIVSGAASGETTLFINGKTDGATVTNNAGMGTFSGAISDGTAGSKLGLWLVSNTQTFSGALTYTGATTIDPRATMVLTGENTSLADSREVNVNGTLNFTGYTGA
ncbi:MAG: autotransporter-associated beta strand repeat-containing protein, partial [Thermoguttaceae bacterium]|nr:autotransporter-associated beta strand repeat-containing protein [Thermoguttaceae bacterium]